MNYEYNDKPIFIGNPYYSDQRLFLWNPLSRNAIEQIEAMGGTVMSKHEYGERPKFHYIVSFPDNKYSASIIKGYGTYGREQDQFEIGVLYDGHLTYDTEITNDVIGNLEEEDIMVILRLINRLDENGHIKPLETSQNEQLS